MIKRDVKILMRFLTTAEGGRKKPVRSDIYRCPMIVNNQAFDCRFISDELKIYQLGKLYEIDVQFLNSEKALSQLQEGKEISLWEGRKIAEGKILEIL